MAPPGRAVRGAPMADIDRRHFLSAALAALALAPPRAGAGQAPVAAAAHRIDVHHHFAPPAWVAEVKGRPLLQVANTRWTPAQSIEDMDRGGVAAAVVSITNPGLWFGDAAVTRRVARACNEYGARLVQDHPGRFGLFAALPMPDVDGTLAEIAYAFDTLKADGVGLFTSFDDRWLGNAAFRPVMEELHRRQAVVHVHPTAANCCRNLDYAPGVTPGSLEYGTDTTRAILGITFSGDAVRYPGIRFIWSHAGGTMPFLAGRIEGAAAAARDRLPDGFLHEVKKFNYDLAGAANAGAVTSLLQLVPAARVLFGTDFPPGGSSAGVAANLAALGLFSPADLRAVERGNAAALLPRLASGR